MRVMWVLMVLSDMNSSAAISWLVRPLVMQRGRDGTAHRVRDGLQAQRPIGSYLRDVYPGVGERPDRVTVRTDVGDELAHRGDVADARERDLADLRAVGDHHHPPGALDHDG